MHEQSNLDVEEIYQLGTAGDYLGAAYSLFGIRSAQQKELSGANRQQRITTYRKLIENLFSPQEDNEGKIGTLSEEQIKERIKTYLEK